MPLWWRIFVAVFMAGEILFRSYPLRNPPGGEPKEKGDKT
jgi:hypothetical protein